jgi:hypothetical protein
MTVSAPAAGDTLTIGLTDTIRWSSMVPVGGKVDIVLYENTVLRDTVAANAENSGSYSWTVPATITQGDLYDVQVISRYNSAVYGSSSVFSIK